MTRMSSLCPRKKGMTYDLAKGNEAATRSKNHVTEI